MSWYSRVIFPRICDFALRNPAVTLLRRELLAHSTGEILEIGFGTGLNLPNYPPQIRKLTVVDPNSGMHRLAKKRIEKTGFQVDQRVLRSEQVPFQDNAFDCVVSTFTLCSVADVAQTLREVFRRNILVPRTWTQPGCERSKMAATAQLAPDANSRWLPPRPEHSRDRESPAIRVGRV